MIAATIVSALACAVLVGAELAHARLARVLAKIAASAAFVTVGVLALPPTSSPFASWIVGGLVFGAIGDVVMLGRGTAPFLGGLTTFLIGHVAYVVGILALHPAGSPALAALPVGAGAIALGWLWPHVPRAMRVPVLAYIAVIVTMVAVALVHGHRLLETAAIAFFVSDLARDRFVVPGVANRVWGLPTYYAAQLLFAWSISTLT